jgi:cyclopropane-fatty-acyl-phospholipid synthase
MLQSFLNKTTKSYPVTSAIAAAAAGLCLITLTIKKLLPVIITSKTVLSFATRLIENGKIPDWLLRIGIRHLIQQRIDSLPSSETASPEVAAEYIQNYVDKIKQAPIALDTVAANEQHYELPPAYFELVLGPRKKYSCCLYERPDSTLAEAEEAAFREVFARARVTNNNDEPLEILDLGCGWGSCTLSLLEKFPNVRVTALSNSKDQGIFIRAKAAERGGEQWTSRLTVLTQDANNLVLPDNHFDRIISIEMLEHMKNYDKVFERLGKTMKQGGIFFAHVFNHRRFPYDFIPDSDKPTSCQKEDEEGFGGEWMARTFFANGSMPSPDLFHYFCGSGGFQLDAQWAVDGKHYARTAEDWLKNQDANNAQVEKILYESALQNCKTEEEKKKLPPAHKMSLQWRLFYLAVAENWNYNNGREWYVSHYRFLKK